MIYGYICLGLTPFIRQLDLLLFPLGLLLFQFGFTSKFSLFDLLNLLRIKIFAQPPNEDKRWGASFDRMRRDPQDIWVEPDYRKDVNLDCLRSCAD